MHSSFNSSNEKVLPFHDCNSNQPANGTKLLSSVRALLAFHFDRKSPNSHMFKDLSWFAQFFFTDIQGRFQKTLSKAWGSFPPGWWWLHWTSIKASDLFLLADSVQAALGKHCCQGVQLTFSKRKKTPGNTCANTCNMSLTTLHPWLFARLLEWELTAQPTSLPQLQTNKHQQTNTSYKLCTALTPSHLYNVETLENQSDCVCLVLYIGRVSWRIWVKVSPRPERRKIIHFTSHGDNKCYWTA